MPRNRGNRIPRNWTRPVDWDSAEFTIAAGEAHGILAVWLRVPSDTTDPLNGDFIEPKTLVRTMVRGSLVVGEGVGNTDFPVFYQGIIAWRGIDGSVLPGADRPDPENGSADWIWNGTTWFAGMGTDIQFVYSDFGGGFGWSESSAMRKLPPQTGILWVGKFVEDSPTSHLVARMHLGVRMALKGAVTAEGLGGG